MIHPAYEFAHLNGTGAFSGIPAETYFAAPGLNHSTLKQLAPPNTPAHARAYMDAPDDQEPDENLVLGTLIHTAILEPEKAESDCIAVKPDGMKFSTTEGKAWRAEKQAAGRIILTEENWTALQALRRHAAEDETCINVFCGGTPEVSCFVGGLKARIDYVPLSGTNALVDCKSTRDASPDGFSKQIAEQHYYSQGAWYLDIWNTLFPDDRRECFVIVALEKRPPYLVKCYNVSAKDLALGRERNRERLALYQRCVGSGRWPGYPGGIADIEIPEWARRRI